jgi:UDP-glucuronate 4-epimerase
MRYMVTGAAGFIGHHVCDRLLATSVNDVDGVDAFTDYYDPSLKRANDRLLRRHARYRSHELDLVTASLDQLLEGADAVIHLAGQPGVRRSWAGFQAYVDRNITATQRLLEAARRTSVPRLVLASSSSVYGNATTYPTSEDSPTRPFSPYGVTKLAMEHLARAYGENWGLPIVLLRYFTVYGPGQRPDMGIHRFIAAAVRGEPVTVYGDGEQVRDFTYVSDAVAATIAAATVDLPPASVLNVAGGSSSTVNEVVRLVAECTGCTIATRGVAEEPGDVRFTAGTTTRARRLLRWEPEVPLHEGIQRQVTHQLRGVPEYFVRGGARDPAAAALGHDQSSM